MSVDSERWKGRRKRIARRVARDLRTALPAMGLAGCFLSSATTIVAVEPLPSRIQVASIATQAETVADDVAVPLSAVSAAPPEHASATSIARPAIGVIPNDARPPHGKTEIAKDTPCPGCLRDDGI